MRVLIIIVLSILPLGLSGCFKHSGLYPVSVQINDNGKPVGGVSITFVGDDESYAIGFTDEQGSAQMYTYKLKDGVKPGSYRVMLSKYETVPLPDIPNDPALDASVPSLPPPPSLIPKKFLSVETSGLTAVVDKKTPPVVFDIGE